MKKEKEKLIVRLGCIIQTSELRQREEKGVHYLPEN
jgi:hypothetical protein